MSLASVFNKLGQTIIPKVAAAAFPDTLTVYADTLAQDTGGAVRKTGTTTAYSLIPCAYEPVQIERRIEQGAKLVSSQEYRITMPTHTAAAARINLDPKSHRLIVAARGNAPAKTFRIIAIGDQSDVVFEVVCQREN